MMRSNNKAARPYLYQTESSLNFYSIICQKHFGEVEDHALTGSKLPKQEVQSARTLLFKM